MKSILYSKLINRLFIFLSFCGKMASWSTMKRTILIGSLSRPRGPSLKRLPSTCGLGFGVTDGRTRPTSEGERGGGLKGITIIYKKRSNRSKQYPLHGFISYHKSRIPKIICYNFHTRLFIFIILLIFINFYDFINFYNFFHFYYFCARDEETYF